jgi:Flp pilus assembly protein TadG
LVKRIDQQRLRGESGQALVEFALVLPALMAILLGIIQFGVVFKDYLTLTDAVREGARKAAVSRNRVGRDGYVKSEVVKSGADLGSEFDTTDVEVTSTWGPGEDVTVTAYFPFSIDVLGFVIRKGELKTVAVERVE